MDIVNPQVEEYMTSLQAQYDEPVLLEMEQEGRERDFPIVGRNVGVTIEVLARSIGARRVMELGSGFGYSAYWFARAVGADGEVHCTDGDPANAAKAEDYLTRAGLWDRVTYHVGDAVEQLATLEGSFDVVYDDIDKHGYPDAWRAGRERIRAGGLYICDNVLWSGRIVEPDPDRNTSAILEHNRLIAEDDRFVSTIVPTRDGVFVALRVG
ncbi:MAG TPA: O-methyltransferase [Actinomycetota bacterium]|jgi:predicted O-methyltransferase YrrM|nr:O-methyltransferase [Actinomycetota bacterium]